MDTRKLKHFVAIAEYGSFGRAADAVCLTQSALSRSIQALEEELGVALFDRTGNRAKLTPAGTILLGAARQLILNSNELFREIQSFKEGHAGRLTIAASPTPASLLLAPFMAHVSNHRPGLRLDTWIGRTPELVEAVRAEKYDIAFVDATAIVKPDGLVVEHLATLPGGFVVRSGHPLCALDQPIGLEELRRYPIASSPLSDDFAQRLITTYGPDWYPSGMISYFCDSYHVLQDLALTTDTVVMTTYAAMRREIKAGRLQVLRLNFPEISGHYAMVRLGGRFVFPALFDLMVYARESFRRLAENSLDD